VVDAARDGRPRVSIVPLFVGMVLLALAFAGFVPTWLSRDVAFLAGWLVLCTGVLEQKLEELRGE